MPELIEKPCLDNLQNYVRQLEVERGFSSKTVLEQCLLLGEEVGELFKAVRHVTGLGIDVNAQPNEADGELADVLILLCSVANRLGISLESALREKELINQSRRWR